MVFANWKRPVIWMHDHEFIVYMPPPCISRVRARFWMAYSRKCLYNLCIWKYLTVLLWIKLYIHMFYIWVAIMHICAFNKCIITILIKFNVKNIDDIRICFFKDMCQYCNHCKNGVWALIWNYYSWSFIVSINVR